jgi:hypothetical protein
MWQPEIGPIAKAIVNKVKPNAKETPTSPMPTSGNLAAKTALPQPPKTSQKVPMSSANMRFPKGIESSLILGMQ